MKKIMIAIAASVFLLSGCTDNNAKPQEIPGTDVIDEEGPDDFAGDEAAGFDWFQAEEDAYGLFTEEIEDSLYSKDFTLEFNEETNTITLFSVISDSATPEEALNYAAEILRRFNDQIISIQAASLESSSESSYGGIYEDHNVKIQVTNESNRSQESSYFVNTEIPAGSDYKPLELQK